MNLKRIIVLQINVLICGQSTFEETRIVEDGGGTELIDDKGGITLARDIRGPVLTSGAGTGAGLWWGVPSPCAACQSRSGFRGGGHKTRGR